MDLQTLSNLKSKFVARQVADELVIVPLSNNVAQMNELFTLNQTGKFIWDHANSEATVENLSNRMCTEFDISIDIAKKDIEDFLLQMDVLKKYSAAE